MHSTTTPHCKKKTSITHHHTLKTTMSNPPPSPGGQHSRRVALYVAISNTKQPQIPIHNLNDLRLKTKTQYLLLLPCSLSTFTLRQDPQRTKETAVTKVCARVAVTQPRPYSQYLTHPTIQAKSPKIQTPRTSTTPSSRICTNPQSER
jgi:hypothetical protein